MFDDRSSRYLCPTIFSGLATPLSLTREVMEMDISWASQSTGLMTLKAVGTNLVVHPVTILKQVKGKYLLD